MRASVTTFRGTGWVVAGLLIVTAALRLAGAGSAPPSPRYKWDQGWDPAWQTTVVPAARAAAGRIIAGEVSKDVIAPLHAAHRNLPVGVPHPITCLAMMENAMAKRLGQPEYGIRRAREAVECYEGATIAQTPTPPRTCGDQVTVTAFEARARVDRPAGTFDQQNPNLFVLNTDPGITFTARVTVHQGQVPLDHLHLRYIQNKTRATGTITYAPPPHLVPVVRRPNNTPTTLPPHPPLLDRAREPSTRVPWPFYDGLFHETNPTGTAREITAADAPVTNIFVFLKETGGFFQAVDLTSTFRTFLVCVDGRSGALEVLRQLEWTLRARGTFDRKTKTFTPDPKTTPIVAQPSGPARDTPVVTAPLSNQASTYVGDR